MSSPDSAAGSLAPAPTLDDLVAYFVAAKRSLSATNHVYHANEIVEEARRLVEEGAVLKAKNSYIQRGVDQQVHVLHSIHGGLEAVGLEAQLDFEIVIKSLDVANDRLQATLSSLRKTIVSSSTTPSSRPGYGSLPEGVADQSNEQETGIEDKTLYDFVDESAHTALLDSLKATIDSYNETQADLHQTRTSLSDALDEVSAALVEINALDSGANAEANPQSPIPDFFSSLTSQATEMASLLQSLISHYDLCITALKHTEGGGEAARAATSNPDPLISTGTDSPTEASLYAGADREAHRLTTITIAERTEMLSVLSHDAAQVTDVVNDIRDGLTSMRTTHADLQQHTSVAHQRFTLLSSIIKSRMTHISSSLLPTCVSSSMQFRQRWSDIRASLVSQTESLTDLSKFHDAFLASYASLLREVERRRAVETKMEKIARRAEKEIEALRAEDEDMRGQFVREVGEWLPRDIWPGLGDAAVGWRVVRDEGRGLGIEGAGPEEVGRPRSRA